MKKNLKVVFIIGIFMALILPITYSYAISKVDVDSKEIPFFEISKIEVSQNEKVEMVIHIEQIQYDQAIFELYSSETLDQIETEEQVEIEKNSNEILIEIDKTMTNLDEITLYYSLPEDVKLNDKLKFVATITNKENSKEQETIETEITIVAKQQENGKDDENQENEEEKINNEEETQNNGEINNENNKQPNGSSGDGQQVNKTNEEEQKNNSQYSYVTQTSEEKTINVNLQSNKSSISTANSEQTEQTVTYNGSNNNYLEQLIVENQNLNKEFTKENTTYFVNVDNSVNSLNITAIAEDSTAIVNIYGNEELKEGSNKILVSVTAENGNVRNYRIYVTKNV